MATTNRVVLFLVVVASEFFVIGAANSSVAELMRERWREKFPDVGIPQPLLKRMSPLSLTQLNHFTKALKNSGDTSFDASHFCLSAGLLCREEVAFEHGCSSHGFVKRTDEQIKEHLFFDKEELRESGEIILPEMDLPRTRMPFLPSELAELMPPFSSANISQILELLDVPSESNMSRNMVSTLKMCEERAEDGEVKRCSTSVEGGGRFEDWYEGGGKAHSFCSCRTGVQVPRIRQGCSTRHDGSFYSSRGNKTASTKFGLIA